MTHTVQIPSSIALHLPVVTFKRRATIDRYGALGVGRLANGRVYVSGGNGHHYVVEGATWIEDGGKLFIDSLLGRTDLTIQRRLAAGDRSAVQSTAGGTVPVSGHRN